MDDVKRRFAEIGQIGALERRIAAYQSFVAAEPSHSPAWFNLATDLAEAGQLAEARRAALRGFSIDPSRRALDRNTRAGTLIRFDGWELLQEIHTTDQQVLYVAARDEQRAYLRRLPGRTDLARLYGEQEVYTRAVHAGPVAKAIGVLSAPDGMWQLLEYVPGDSFHEIAERHRIDVDVAAGLVASAAVSALAARAAGLPPFEIRPETLVRADDLARGIVALGPFVAATGQGLWAAPEHRTGHSSESIVVYQLSLLLYRMTMRRDPPLMNQRGERGFDAPPATWAARWVPLIELARQGALPNPAERPSLDAWHSALRALLDQRSPDAASRGRRLGGVLVQERIGEGQFGVAYRGQDEEGRPRAIKILHRHFAADGEMLMRFRNERRVASEIAHSAIVATHGGGRGDDGEEFLLMEYMAGGSLDSILAARVLDPAETAALGIRIGSAMAAAHRRGVIHRDLKPANLLLRRKGDLSTTCVGDFGIAKLLGEPGEPGTPFTRTGRLLGTPQYMAPEQWRMEPIDARTDVYALGVILHRCVAGELPFAARNEYLLQQAHLTAAPPDLTTRGVPGGLAAIIDRMLAKSPSDRFRTMDDVVNALQAWQRSETDQMAATRVAGVAEHAPRSHRTAAPITERVEAAEPYLESPPRVSRRTVLIAGSVLAVGTVGVIGWLASRGDSGSPSSPTPPPPAPGPAPWTDSSATATDPVDRPNPVAVRFHGWVRSSRLYVVDATYADAGGELTVREVYDTRAALLMNPMKRYRLTSAGTVSDPRIGRWWREAADRSAFSYNVLDATGLAWADAPIVTEATFRDSTTDLPRPARVYATGSGVAVEWTLYGPSDDGIRSGTTNRVRLVAARPADAELIWFGPPGRRGAYPTAAISEVDVFRAGDLNDGVVLVVNERATDGGPWRYGRVFFRRLGYQVVLDYPPGQMARANELADALVRQRGISVTGIRERAADNPARSGEVYFDERRSSECARLADDIASTLGYGVVKPFKPRWMDIIVFL